MNNTRHEGDGYYYHAGAYDPVEEDVRWSGHTRKSADIAEGEAIALAVSLGSTYEPFVEYWDKEHGLRPGTADCVLGCWRVAK